MAFASLKKYEHTFIVVAALTIALLNTLPFFSGIFTASDNASNPFFNTGFILRRSLWQFGHAFISMLLFIYFNYKWVNYIIPFRVTHYMRVILIILGNLGLLYAMLWATVIFAEHTVGNPFGMRYGFLFYLWKYVLLHPLGVLVAYTLKMIVKSKIIEIENFKLKEENLSIQLKTLQDQVNPHFLFNTLNTLSSVIRLGNKEEGLKFVDDLSNVYRYILDTDMARLTKVRTEIKFLESYKYMLEKRFGNNLDLKIDISNEVKESLIPPMVFQLLLENAIKHNQISQATPLQITIANDKNFIIFSNNINNKPDAGDKLGLGLPNLIKRYELMAGKEVIIQQKDDHFIVKLPVIHP
jgi:two-component system, LytTR family, sensor kinase